MSQETEAAIKAITIVVFCYRGEEEILPMTLGRAKAAFPTAKLHLFDDSLDPLRPATVAQLSSQFGCSYSVTTFDRQVNLNGKECVIGELESMVSAMDADDNKDGYLIKMDPDTIVLRPEYVLNALARGAEFIAHNSVKGVFAGMFYVAKRDIIEAALVTAREASLPDACAEDCTIGSLCYLTAHRRPHVWMDVATGINARYFAALPTACLDGPSYWNDIVFCSRAGCILTVGNTALDGWSKGYQTKLTADLLWAFYNPDEALQRVTADFRPKLDVPQLPALPIQNEGARRISQVKADGHLVLKNPILAGKVTVPKQQTISVGRDNPNSTPTSGASSKEQPTIDSPQVLAPEVPEEDVLQIID
jgi:hypothetical protein